MGWGGRVIVAMAGLPGTGKSAIARRLAGALPALVLDKDRIRAALFAPEDIEYSTEQDDFCTRLMLQTASYVLGKDRGRHVILDGRTFSRRYQVAGLDAFAAHHAIPLKIVECICSDETAHRRLRRDVEQASHLAANRDSGLYRAIKARFEPIREPKIVVNTDDELDACVAACLAALRDDGETGSCALYGTRSGKLSQPTSAGREDRQRGVEGSSVTSTVPAATSISTGKARSIAANATPDGIIAALAMDQRGSLRTAIADAVGRPVAAAELAEFKALVTEVLSPYASAVLLDPEYGLEAAARRSPQVGVLLAYEKSGYDTTVKGRFPDLLPAWSVRRLVAAGAQGIKIVLYYDPDDEPGINAVKHAFVERIGAECRAHDVAFFLEPVTYAEGLDTKSAAFARLKPGKVARAMEVFSRPEYGVDILKVEIPINARFLEGSRANSDGTTVYTHTEAIEHFQRAAAAARVPFIYLSAGVSDEVFRETLELAAAAGVPYSGVLCGRATWQGGIAAYAGGGATALRAWLEDRGVRNIAALNDQLTAGATPWWDMYGGKDHVAANAPRYATASPTAGDGR